MMLLPSAKRAVEGAESAPGQQPGGSFKRPPVTGGLTGIKPLMPTPTAQAPTGAIKPLPMPTVGTLPAQAPATPTAPAMPLPGGVPSVPGAAMSTINPSADLRSQAITPNNAQAPNLTALATQKYQDFLKGTADERQQGVRQIGQAAAKFGRIGAGMTTNQLTSLEDLLQRRENEAARGLASDVAISDLGEQRSQRDELRGERGYQYGVGENAIDRRVQERMLEEQLLNSQFGRDATRTQMGYQGNPSGMQFDASESYGRTASDALGGVGDYLGNKELMAALEAYLKKQGGTTAPGAGPPVAPVYDGGGY